MALVWNIGNTTVRNPKRIEKALKVFLDEGFSGNAKGKIAEKRIHRKLKEAGVLDFEGESSDWAGRKWRAAFYQLGFISKENKHNAPDIKENTNENSLFAESERENSRPFEISESGLRLIHATGIPEIEEIYTRQFLCYEIPSTLEPNFPQGKMKPFVLFLQVLHALHLRNMSGLTKIETGLFLQLFQNHTNELYNTIVEKILIYRSDMEECKSTAQRKKVKEHYLSELNKNYKINPTTVTKDYADTTFRYFSLSGLFTRENSTIIIRPNKLHHVQKILEKEPTFLFQSSKDYFRTFYSNDYALPIDDNQFNLHDIQTMVAALKGSAKELVQEAKNVSIQSDLKELNKVRYRLIDYHNREREEDYAARQGEDGAIQETIDYLKTLAGKPFSGKCEIDDRPAYLEWAVWRSFLAINNITCPVHKTRRFPVDEDFLPRNTAPGGGPDLIFEFENYFLVVEVTLTISSRQMAVESEPVRRHTARYKIDNIDKDVYCLFVAPEIDSNTAETFRIGVWYDHSEEIFLNIVPFKITEFIVVMETLLTKRFNNEDFKNLLDRCLIYRNVRAPQWKENIGKEIVRWKKSVT
ncbi:MAG: AlwI family type II restriction endonuclease [Leptospirales bacterium]